MICKRVNGKYQLIVCLLVCVLFGSAFGGFGAYYTKIDSGQEFERFSRTGPEADIVVCGIGKDDGRLVFWRGSSYLPYWQVGDKKWFLDELTERSGDGPDGRPDKVNTYSFARIVENTPKQVLIHWRYLPKFEGTNPHFNAANIRLHHKGGKGPKHLVETTEFVDEYFTIKSDGKVTRTFKRGTEKYDDWADGKNVMTQEFRLTGEGIKAVKTAQPGKSAQAKPVKGRPVCKEVVAEPVKWWKFDEGAGDVTTESVAGNECVIEGHRSYWKRGVSGTALAFDGYTSAVRLDADKMPAIDGSVTLEGWVAIGAYPWNFTPIVQQGHDESFYLGIGPYGRVRMVVKVGGKVEQLESSIQLKRKRWYHIAGTYDKDSGVMRIYINGNAYGGTVVETTGITPGKSPVQIGKGKKLRQTNPCRPQSTFPDSFSFDGLIDEVRIYDKALSQGQVGQSYRALELSDEAHQNPDLDKRVLPAGHKTGKFGAYYSHLKFYDTWDGMFRFGDHPDVVVEFDKQPTSFVFWRGVCYIPMIVNESGQWYSNEFNETWNRSGGRGCQEPMSDKESFSNHIKIIENTPARAVVLWRYPLVDVHHVIANYNEETGWGDWGDWYFYVYPDGVAAKVIGLWTDGSSRHEFQEGMVITGPDQHPEQVVETDPALILTTLAGESREYSWTNGPPRNTNYKDVKIHVVNFKSKYDPFAIGDFNGGNVYGGEVTEYSVIPSWNHWPVAQMPSDGRYASFPDRTAHSSLTHIYGPTDKDFDSDRPYERMLMLEGMSEKKPKELISLAKSWLHAPKIKVVSGCTTLGYDQAKREYPLVATTGKMAVTIDASKEQPIVNMCFTVRNWGDGKKAKVLINGKKPDEVRQGTIVDTDGKTVMVIWIEIKATGPTEFTISGAAPAAYYSIPAALKN